MNSNTADGMSSQTPSSNEALLSDSDRRRIFASFILAAPEVYKKEVPNMPITKEFTIRLEDKPRTLGKLCQALAAQDVNILAYQQFPHEKGKGSVRLVVDNPDKTRASLVCNGAASTETEVAKVMLANRPGELARIASRLGDKGININYGYSGAEPGANASILILGVAEAGKAVKLLEQTAAAGATT